MATNSNKTIQALRLYGSKDLRLDCIQAQPCGADEIRVAIAYCGICGTDLHEYNYPVLCPKPGEVHPLTGTSLPVTLGHEMSGTITELGGDVEDLAVGDAVTVNPAIVERHVGLPPCEDCSAGFPNICRSLSNYGLGGSCGGFADEVVVKWYSALKLPPTVSLKVGALVEPLAVAWHSARTANFQEGQDALILGAGPIGLAILQVLKVFGARHVIVSDVLDVRKKHAAAFGATKVVDPLQDSVKVVETVRQVCGDRGVDVAFDASGLQTTLDTAIACVKPRGTIFNVAIHEKGLVVNPTQLSLQEKVFRGGNSYTNEDFASVIAAISDGRLEAESMVTAVVPLENVVEKGFIELLHKKSNHVKILVQPIRQVS
ncbi:GroES-like protein [Rhizodiscina lignyota]|uniref:GroES-like protein n=1 Tax=Rhizodiscina lignyota TaxID=1504668 RepID=A0A9P4IR08_9PEZI|nr:GroES-like protein [Rhizodiscina lignyota]